MIYLIGVDHVVQHLNEEASPRKAELVSGFAHHVEEAVKTFGATMIAEEFSTEALRNSNARISTAQTVADALGIRHRFCDPTSDERVRLGIAKSDHRRKEQCWLDCIKDNQDENIIFICGCSHLESFASLLVKEGFRAHIHSQGWGLGFIESPF